jgi:pimeloyl-ACP methyl ester carboxylesterase
MKSLFLPAAGAVIRYHDLPGAEPAVVLLHGLGAAGSSDLVGTACRPPLNRRRRLVIDFLGFGYSDRPQAFGYSLEDHAATVAAVVEAAGVAGCGVIGHSMGGTVAIVLASRRPDLVSALVVAEGNLDPGVGGGSACIAAWSEEEYLAHGHVEMQAGIDAEARGGDPGWSAYAAAFRLADPRAVHRSAAGLLAPIDPTARERLYRFAGPKAYVFGERSLPDPDQKRLAAAGVTVLVVPGATHAMAVERPDEFARLVGGFLDPATS